MAFKQHCNFHINVKYDVEYSVCDHALADNARYTIDMGHPIRIESLDCLYYNISYFSCKATFLLMPDSLISYEYKYFAFICI